MSSGGGPDPLAPPLIYATEINHIDFNTSLFDLNKIDKDFQNQLLGISEYEYFTKRQVERISNNISFKNGSPVESVKVHQIKVQVANRYISKYKLKAIPKNRRLGCVALFPKRHHSSR
jgi:hypothetical protein